MEGQELCGHHRQMRRRSCSTFTPQKGKYPPLFFLQNSALNLMVSHSPRPPPPSALCPPPGPSRAYPLSQPGFCLTCSLRLPAKCCTSKSVGTHDPPTQNSHCRDHLTTDRSLRCQTLPASGRLSFPSTIVTCASSHTFITHHFVINALHSDLPDPLVHCCGRSVPNVISFVNCDITNWHCV